MTTKEQDFKQRLIAIIRDLNENGRKDAEAMLLVGRFASNLMAPTGAKTWPEFKRALTAAGHDQVLAELQAQGNHHYREGNDKPAYAIQLLAASMVARTQRDLDVQAGDKLLDQAIEASLVLHRRVQAGAKAN